MDFGHAFGPCPVLRRVEQQFRHPEVVNGVEPSEPGPFLRIEIVVAGVDHPANASHDLFPVQDHPHLALAVSERRHIRQRLHLVRMQGRDILRTVPVKIVRKLYEFPDVPLSGNFYNLVIRHSTVFGYGYVSVFPAFPVFPEGRRKG